MSARSLGTFLVICGEGREEFTEVLLTNLGILTEDGRPAEPIPSGFRASMTIEIRQEPRFCHPIYLDTIPDKHWVRRKDWTQRQARRSRR